MLMKYFAIKRRLESENLNDENKKIVEIHFHIKSCKLRHVAWLISYAISKKIDENRQEFHCNKQVKL